MTVFDGDVFIDNTGGVWECGQCHRPTTETHFFLDLATQTMGHEANAVRRAERAAQCGWRFDDDYGTHDRCRLRTGHGGGIHQGWNARWREDALGLCIRPAVPEPDGCSEGEL